MAVDIKHWFNSLALYYMTEWKLNKTGLSLKWKCHHFDYIFITGCTGRCQNDNFQCSQWREFDQNDNISVVTVLWWPIAWWHQDITWARFLSLALRKLRLCSVNHRPGYWSNLPCDWLSPAWAYSEQETENGPWVNVKASSDMNKFPRDSPQCNFTANAQAINHNKHLEITHLKYKCFIRFPRERSP